MKSLFIIFFNMSLVLGTSDTRNIYKMTWLVCLFIWNVCSFCWFSLHWLKNSGPHSLFFSLETKSLPYDAGWHVKRFERYKEISYFWTPIGQPFHPFPDSFIRILTVQLTSATLLLWELPFPNLGNCKREVTLTKRSQQMFALSYRISKILVLLRL